jgi:PKD repeat protein
MKHKITISGKGQEIRFIERFERLSRVFMLTFTMLASFISISSVGQTVCCPDFYLKDAVDICPPEGQCMGGTAPNGQGHMAACKLSAHTYTVYPNTAPYTYTWTVSGGTVLPPNPGNPVTIVWGSGTTGFIKVVIDGGGCHDSITQEICLVDGPQASFTAVPNPICAGGAVTFTNTSTGGSSYLWDFGDGTTSTLASPPPHFYPGPGPYTVILTAQDVGTGQQAGDLKRPCGCIDTASVVINILPGTGPSIETTCCYGTVCPGDTSSFCTPVVCGTYNWTVTGGVIISGAGTPCIKIKWNAAYSGPTTVSLAVPGCGTAPCPGSTTLNVPVLYPNLPITGPNPLCVGSAGSFFLPSMPGTFYTWTTNAPAGTFTFNDKDRNVANVNITFNVAGSYIITCTYNNPLSGCSGVSTFPVNVLPVYSIFGADKVCQYSTNSYFGSGMASWTVSPLTGVILPPGPAISKNITFNSPGFYNVTATPPPGVYCNLNAVKVVQVVAVPVLAAITGPNLVCPGSIQAFGITSNTTGSLYTWSVNNGAAVQMQFGEDQDSAIIKFTGTAPWTVSVYQEIEISPGVMCQSLTQTLVVNVYGPPVITPSPPPAITVCVDASTSFSASGPTPVTWAVTPSFRGSIVSGQGTNSVLIRWHGAPGPATVSATNCGGTSSVVVNVVDPPFISAISCSGPIYYCLPSVPGGLTLSTSAGPYTYSWTGPPGFVPPGNTNTAFVPATVFTPVPGSFTFTVTASNGTCSTTKTITIVVQSPPCSGIGNPPPCTVDFTISPNPACVGQPVTFTVVPNGSGWSYQWAFGDGPSTSYTSPTEHTYLVASSYNVTVTATLGTCTVSKVHTVVVNPTPSCTITTPDTTFCPGGFTPLLGCSGQSSYQWIRDGVQILGATNMNYNASTIGNYWLEVTNIFGCTNISNKIYIYKKARPIAKITGDGIICTTGGGVTTLNMSSYYNANYTYSWSSNPAGATFSPNNSNASFYTTATLTVPLVLPYTCAFIVHVQDVVTGCENYDTLCVTFYETPTVTVPFVSGCEGPSYTLVPTPNNPAQYHYQWSNGKTTPVITVSTNGVYSVTITDKVSGCEGSTTAAMIFPLPDLSLFPYGCDSICDTASIQMYIPLPLNWVAPFNTYASAYPLIQWFDNGNYGTPIGVGPTFPFSSAVLGNHQISVVVGNVYGCTDTAGVRCINVRHCAPSQGLDFGDAPDIPGSAFNYQTLLPNGARHNIVPGVRMGILIDAEPNGQPNIPASGDDINTSDDEDGVTIPPIIQIGSSFLVTVQASVNGYVDAWIDYNINGTWIGPGEQILINQPVILGPNTFTITVPATATMGQSYARFRFHTANGTIPFNGLANDGEVEDYPVFINECCQGEELDFGDVPDMPLVGFNYPTLLASNGARHIVCANIRLGALIDSETDGQPNTPATGDDILTSPDEDGVQFVGTMYVGMPATIKVTASIAGFLNAWMDFNKDGDWADTGEQMFVNQPLVPGVNTLTFMIPTTAVQGKTYARFRFNTIGGLNYYGLAVNGEVEDYRVHDCPHWMPIPTNLKHYITIPHDLQNLYAGDVLGVFYSDASGTQACAGLAELDGSTDKIMIAYGDNPATPVKDGFAVGEPIIWKLCSVVKGDANPVDVIYDFTYPNSTGLFAQNGISALSEIIGLHVTATSAPGTICNGDAVQLHADVSNSQGIAFSWSSVPAGFTSTLQNPVDQPLVNTVYYVEAFDGVFHATSSVSVTVTQVNPLVAQLPLNNITVPTGDSRCYNATQSIIVAGNGTQFTVQSGGSVTMIAGQSILFKPGAKANSGSYLHGYITTSGTYCCGLISPPAAKMEGETTGVEPLADKSFFKVYPNPTTSTFTLELNGEAADSKVSVEIYGILGEKILKKEVSGNRQVFDLSGKQHGVYLIRVMNGSESGMAKIIKQ